MATYDIGDEVRMTATFTDLDGNNADPTTVTCTVEDPDGTTSTPTVQNPNVGVYYADISPDQAGKWWFRFDGTGALVAAEEGSFAVRKRQVE